MVQINPQPGMHEFPDLPYPYDSLDGISEQVVTWHHDKHSAGYAKKRNTIEKKLAAMDPSSADFDSFAFAGLKRHEAYNAAGMILHIAYWECLGGNSVADPNLPVVKAINACWGSTVKWRAELAAVAKGATGWALTCYDPSDGRLHNYLVDEHHEGAVWDAQVVVALDVFEHAYYHDYGPDRAKYIDAYFRNLHWGRINQRFQEATR